VPWFVVRGSSLDMRIERAAPLYELRATSYEQRTTDHGKFQNYTGPFLTSRRSAYGLHSVNGTGQAGVRSGPAIAGRAL